ncbi:MAG: phospholipase D family protein [Gammaproteobacteria bacterium]|nr:phospholipase D family protein [Gammaproteobacteria bacterium]
MINKIRWFIVFTILFPALILGAPFLPNAHYQVCFTPGQNCIQLITKTIDQAHHQVFMQAYSFTSMPIARALVSAQNRGVDVKVILDKSQFENSYYALSYLIRHKVPIWCDYRVQIAHNKVMVLDDSTVITGSFNFTSAAQYKNAENLLVIHDPNLAHLYHQNWDRRLHQSRQFTSKKAYYLHKNFVKTLQKFWDKVIHHVMNN